MSKKNYKYEVIGDVAYINLDARNGESHICIIDTNRLNDFLNFKYSWFCGYRSEDKDYYVQSTIYLGMSDGKPINKTILLHDFLLGFPETEHIDHINNNRLDNRISNLRLSTIEENNKNRRKRNSNNKSGYRNVCMIDGWWRIQIQMNGKIHRFKEKFKDVEDAGRFAEEMRKIHYKEFAGNS